MTGLKPTNSLCRMRVRFFRTGEAKSMSQLEQIKMLRRIALESGLPCAPAKSGGEGRNIKMSFGPAVSVGYESFAEYSELYLTRFVKETEVADSLIKVCPSGFGIMGVKRVPANFPSLESLVNAAEYEIRGNFGANPPKISDFLSRSEIIINKTKPGGLQETIDARPLIVSMEYEPERGVKLVLRFGPKRNLKPEKIIGAWLGIDFEASSTPVWAITRKELYWENEKGQLSLP